MIEFSPFSQIFKNVDVKKTGKKLVAVCIHTNDELREYVETFSSLPSSAEERSVEN
jgi:lipid II:glycine glycyltransferase (peptidoglycan interpeptide bridge formation enzyme)